MSSSSSCTDVLVVAPPPGTVVGLAPGSRLRLRLRSGLGPSRWFVTERPGHLLPLGAEGAEGAELTFLVFAGAPGTLRLERRHPRSGAVREVCEVQVVVSGSDLLVRSA